MMRLQEAASRFYEIVTQSHTLGSSSSDRMPTAIPGDKNELSYFDPYVSLPGGQGLHARAATRSGRTAPGPSFFCGGD
jgi:hypothetical protein